MTYPFWYDRERHILVEAPCPSCKFTGFIYYTSSMWSECALPEKFENVIKDLDKYPNVDSEKLDGLFKTKGYSEAMNYLTSECGAAHP